MAAACVWIIEDDADVREAVATLLQVLGFAVREFESAVAAIEHVSAGTPPDVIVLDEMLPGMNGSDFLALLRANPRHEGCGVISFTAAPPTDSLADVVHRKPGNIPLLVRQIEALLDRSRPCDPTRTRRSA